MRLVNALIKAGKDFEMLVVPNANHGMGGAYGERRMHEFFVRHLQNGRDSRRVRIGGIRSADRHSSTTDVASSKTMPVSSASRSSATRPIGAACCARGGTGLAEAGRASPRLHFGLARPARPARIRPARPRRAGGLPPVPQPPEPRAPADRDPAQERAEWEPMVPFARPILDLEAAQARAQAHGLGEGRRGLERRLAKEIDESRRELEREARARIGPRKPVPTVPSGCGPRIAALASVEGLRNTLRTWFAFYDGYDPVFSWWMQEPYKAADQALQAHAGFLRQRYGASAAGAGATQVSAAAGGEEGGGGPGGGGGAPADRPAPAIGPRATRPARCRDRRHPDRPRGPDQRARARDDRLHARGAARPGAEGAGLVRGRDEEGRARDGPGRRLAWRAGTRQDAARRARRAAHDDPRPRPRGHRLSRHQRPRDDPAALPRLVADDDDVARAAAREPLLPGRRDDHRLLSDEHDGPRSQDDEHAGQ